MITINNIKVKYPNTFFNTIRLVKKVIIRNNTKLININNLIFFISLYKYYGQQND